MKWLKTRTTWAWGIKDWKYNPFFINKIDSKIEDWVKMFVKSIHDENNWSDKYRGVDYEIINTKQVPNLKIKREIEQIEDNIKYMKESIKTETKNLAEIKALSEKGRKTDLDEIRHAKRKKKYDAILAKAR